MILYNIPEDLTLIVDGCRELCS